MLKERINCKRKKIKEILKKFKNKKKISEMKEGKRKKAKRIYKGEKII